MVAPVQKVPAVGADGVVVLRVIRTTKAVFSLGHLPASSMV